MRAGQQTALSAVAVDDDGQAIQGLPVSWESSDESVIFIRPDGRARAGNPGRAHIKARAGNKQELVQVIVLAAALPVTVPPTPQTLSRTEKTQNASMKRNGADVSNKLSEQRAHSANMPDAMPQQGPPDLPQGDVPTLYEKRNAVGSPPNRYFPSAQTPPAANRNGREFPGSDNYSFSVPITNLPGRGIDVSLALNYNSSLWHKTGSASNNLTFDVDKSWPVPGFRLGYGHLSQQNDGSFEMVDSDGTRHQLLQSSPYQVYPIEYTSTDGTFIHAVGNIFPTLTYTDGTQVYYGASSYNGTNTTYYPTRITERHGNYLLINYQTDSYGHQTGPRITSISDTLGRMVRFYYDGNNNLVTITAPSYANGGERQEVRFYYDTLQNFTNSAKFASNITVNNRPSSVQVIKYIYFPGTQTGYRYDYSPYGMIRQITQLRGMQVSPQPPPQPTTQIGQVISDGQVAATTTYGYPDTTPSAGLTAAPTYGYRTDNWAGNTAGTAATLFEVGTTTKITAPDGSYSETMSDGTTDTTEVKWTSQVGATSVYSRTKIEWEADYNSQNRRVHRVQTATDPDQPTGKTKTIGYTYTDYNNIDEIIEYDFNTAPDTPGPILRRTKTTYVTD